MGNETALDLIDRQDWLEPAAERLQEAIHQSYKAAGDAGQQIKNALHGTWLGHPLHAVLTDVPVGAWTAALVCDALEDITGTPGFGKGADVAVAAGLIGAVGAAVTGLTDWSETDDRARRLGLVHGLLNTCAAGLYAASLVYRKQDQRTLGRGLSLLGYAVAFGSAWLGGELVYTEKVGVNQAPLPAQLPKEFVAVLPDSDLDETELKEVEVNGTPILLARTDSGICAIAETCSHAGGPLAEGKREGDTVVCPWHGSRFDLKTGRVIDGPATSPEPCLEARIRDGQIEVRVKA